MNNPDIARAVRVLAQQLTGQQRRVATAESCTGGGIAQAMTDVAGSSAWFERGVVSYSNEAKQELLGVKPATLENHGAVSKAVALEMACGVLQRSRAQVSVAVTGVAGPGGGSPEKPVGLVWIAWGLAANNAQAHCFQFTGDRRAVREKTVLEAIQGLNSRLE